MQENNYGFYILPVVYMVPYPVPVPEQLQRSADRDRAQEKTERLFKLPYPEDDG